LDLEFLPKDLLYNDSTYEQSQKSLLAAIEILENAQQSKSEIQNEGKEAKTLWDRFSTFMNPFKCGV
jgi:hypothetical protein